MSFLSVCGIDLSVKDVGRSPFRVQPDTYSQDNDCLVRQRKHIQTHNFQTSYPLSASEAGSLEGLLDGRGNHIDFEASVFGSMGLGPKPGETLTVTSTASGKWGNYGAVTALTYGTGYTKWSAMYWRNPGGGWTDHWVHRSDGDDFLNGVATGTAHSWFTGSADGDLVFGACNIDDLVIFPFLLDAGHIASIYAWASEFPDLPALSAVGDFSNNVVVLVNGETGRQSGVSHQGAAWVNNARNISFALEEIE